ncbi:hypothetical protein FRC04_007400 [Tulasnella sp. 424]|nr:hypothetical protein FRC04_007400 [Tulasnella sp. 424]
MENCPSDRKQVTRADDDIVQECEGIPTLIDVLPIELLEWVIHLGATDSPDGGPSLKWVCTWRQVCRKWAFAIDGCPSLWSSIDTRLKIQTWQNQLARSGASPLDITVYELPQFKYMSDRKLAEWMRPLIDHAHRWRSLSISSISLCKFLWERIAILDSSLPMLEILSLTCTRMASDFKFFNSHSIHLRKLALAAVHLPRNFEPPFELEELYLSGINEPGESGTYVPISMRRLHRFLQASPGLRSFTLNGPCTKSAEDGELPPVDLHKLQDVKIDRAFIVHLFRAEHCAQVAFNLGSLAADERPPLMAWATLVHALKRAEELEILIRDGYLRIWSKPNTVRLSISLQFARLPDYGDSIRLMYSILKDILNEAERDSSLTARIKLTLWNTEQWNRSFDIALKVLKLLQTPITEPSSGLTRRRLPHLSKLRIPKDSRPFQPFHAFERERRKRGGGSSQASRAMRAIRVSQDQMASEFEY